MLPAGYASDNTGAPAAGPGPDVATGHGLADAYQATLRALQSRSS